ncbi:hypothetical protein Ahy_A03g013355 isoform B [Arachis hypogaea]|uniref:Uncharacterized protein n=1 Tax=Arachis hypogaea TaxID=3818 RepID=A0A445DV63_ARAHY|nr:hypothetical protein Ahy_A03g013355 isoform B [Arachis hypogaea]
MPPSKNPYPPSFSSSIRNASVEYRNASFFRSSFATLTLKLTESYHSHGWSRRRSLSISPVYRFSHGRFRLKVVTLCFRRCSVTVAALSRSVTNESMEFDPIPIGSCSKENHSIYHVSTVGSALEHMKRTHEAVNEKESKHISAALYKIEARKLSSSSKKGRWPEMSVTEDIFRENMIKGYSFSIDGIIRCIQDSKVIRTVRDVSIIAASVKSFKNKAEVAALEQKRLGIGDGSIGKY